MYLLEPIEGWASSMFEPLESRVMLSAALPLMDEAIIRNAGGGRVLLAGVNYEVKATLVIRLAADGTPDLTFGRGGVARISRAIAYDFETEIDGTALVLADEMGRGLAIYHLTADGKIDRNFGLGGRAVVAGISTRDLFSADMTVQPDGRILVGAVQYAEGPSTVEVIRYAQDGRLDPTFGAGGTTAIRASDAALWLNTVQVHRDGGIDIFTSTDNDGEVYIRLKADGSPDESFGQQGVAVVVYEDWYLWFYILPGGRTVAINWDFPAATHDPPMWMYDRDGHRVTSFAPTDLPPLIIEGPVDMWGMPGPLISAGDRLILGIFPPDGSFGTPGLIALHEDGSIDADWGSDASRLLGDDPTTTDDAMSLWSTPDGDVIESHQSFGLKDLHHWHPRKLVINRFGPDGQPKAGFGVSGRVTFDLNAPRRPKKSRSPRRRSAVPRKALTRHRQSPHPFRTSCWWTTANWACCGTSGRTVCRYSESRRMTC